MKMNRKKIFALVMATVILTAALSGCKSSTGDKEGDGGEPGDMTVGGSSSSGTTTSSGDTTTQPPETQKPDDPPTTEKPLSVNLDPGLVGKWDRKSHLNNNSVDKAANKFIRDGVVYTRSPIVNEAQVFEFYGDGTFFYFYHVDQYYQAGIPWSGLVQYKGNYRVEGEFIYCTGVMKSWTDYDDPESSYDFKISDNFKLGYHIVYTTVTCDVCKKVHNELRLNDSNFGNEAAYNPDYMFLNWNGVE